jgi:hypothetical protein
MSFARITLLGLFTAAGVGLALGVICTTVPTATCPAASPLGQQAPDEASSVGASQPTGLEDKHPALSIPKGSIAADFRPAPTEPLAPVAPAPTQSSARGSGRSVLGAADLAILGPIRAEPRPAYASQVAVRPKQRSLVAAIQDLGNRSFSDPPPRAPGLAVQPPPPAGPSGPALTNPAETPAEPIAAGTAEPAATAPLPADPLQPDWGTRGNVFSGEISGPQGSQSQGSFER